MIKCKELIESSGSTSKLYFSSGTYAAGSVKSSNITENKNLYLDGVISAFDTINEELITDFLIEDENNAAPEISILNIEDFLPNLTFKPIRISGSTLPHGLYCVSPSEDIALTYSFNNILATSGSTSVWRVEVCNCYSVDYQRFDITDLVSFLRTYYRNDDNISLTDILEDIAKAFDGVYSSITSNQILHGISYNTEQWFNIMKALVPELISGTYNNPTFNQSEFLKKARNIPTPTITLHQRSYVGNEMDGILVRPALEDEGEFTFPLADAGYNVVFENDIDAPYITLDILKADTDSFRSDLKIHYLLRSQEQGFIVPTSSTTGWRIYPFGERLGINTDSATYFDVKNNFVGQIVAVCTTQATEGTIDLESNSCSKMISKPSSKNPESILGDNLLILSNSNAAAQELLLNPTSSTTEALAGVVLG